MQLINNKSIKIFSLITVLIIVIIVIFSKIFPINNFSNLPTDSITPLIASAEEKKVDEMVDESIKAQLDRNPTLEEEASVLSNLGLGTTESNWKNLGIEIAKMPSSEEKNLYLMTIESIKAQLEYYSTKKEESLDKVKSLFLPEAFIQYKEYVKQEAVQSRFQFYSKIKNVIFSKPRAYKDLPDKIGMITYISFITKDTNNLVPLFIFKNVNGEWKIEKQHEIIVQMDFEENALIQEIKNGK